MPTIKLIKSKPRLITYNKSLYQRIYQSRRWRRLRAFKFANNPVCELCALAGETTVATEIHHIKPFDVAKNDDELFDLAYDYDNLVSVCTPHHKYLHTLLNHRKAI